MAVVIALCPETERGRQILDELEKQAHTHPMKRLEDGTRPYHHSAQEADVDAFDATHNQIDPDWRHHVTNWRAAEGFPGTPSSKHILLTAVVNGLSTRRLIAVPRWWHTPLTLTQRATPSYGWFTSDPDPDRRGTPTERTSSTPLSLLRRVPRGRLPGAAIAARKDVAVQPPMSFARS
jgi:hypothetical protein